MEWKSKIIESNDDIDLDIIFYQLFSQEITPPVTIIASNKILKKLMPKEGNENER